MHYLTVASEDSYIDKLKICRDGSINIGRCFVGNMKLNLSRKLKCKQYQQDGKSHHSPQRASTVAHPNHYITDQQQSNNCPRGWQFDTVTETSHDTIRDTRTKYKYVE